MALTDTQKSQIAMYLGWSSNFAQTDSLLNQMLSAIETRPTDELLITDTLVNGGFLASLANIDTLLAATYGRNKVAKFGTVALNPKEIYRLRKEGERFVGRLSRLLGVPVRSGGPYSTSLPDASTTRGGFRDGGGGNYVGK